MSSKVIAAQSGDDESKNDSESSLSPMSPPSDKAESMPSNSTSLLSPVQSMVTSVTNTTKKIVGKSTETTKDLVDTTRKNTMEVIESSKSSIENSSNPCLFPLKCLLHFPRHFPRTNAIIWVVLWLWILILVSMGFGIKLAQAESPQEIEDNDAILAARATIEYYRITNTSLLSVIGECIVDINQTQLQESVEECVQSYLPYIQAYQEAFSNYSATASESLSFNWNRCWELRGQPQFFLYPTTEMISAAHPQSQAAYYEQEWTRVQQELYQDILSQNATLQDEKEALLQSIAHASGADACEENMAGTAWFFFTIMTTVGYGNQAPVTPRGRIIVVSAGLLSLILFAVVLGLCGYVVLAIFDDAVGRLGCLAKTILTNPLFGLVMWGTIWLVYAVSLAKDFEYWWEVRLPEFAMETDHADMLWFAFISTSTIGLGDFYLQPEIMFASDSLKYSALYMIGFVFLSTFFGKILETLNYYVLPSQHNRLENRLAKTRVLAFWPKGWMPWEKAPAKGNDDDDDLLEANADSNNPDDQALLYRIEQLKRLKPDPPRESRRRSVMSTLAGNSIHSLNLELLQKEESLLCEWLAVVRYQQRRAAVFHGTFNRDPDSAFPQTIFEEEGERKTDEEDKTE